MKTTYNSFWSGQPANGATTTYGYDNVGNLQMVTYPNGVVHTLWDGVYVIRPGNFALLNFTYQVLEVVEIRIEHVTLEDAPLESFKTSSWA